MKTLTIDGLHVEDHGGDGPPLVFSHGLLWSTRMWGPQIQALKGRYRCVAFDHRGQGRSQVPRDRAVTLERNTTDAVTVLDALGLERVRFVGLSMGGFVGMRLAARFPDRIEKLALLCTAADPEPDGNRGKYQKLVMASKVVGVKPLVGQVMPILFGDTFMARKGEPTWNQWRDELSTNGRSVTKCVLGVIERDGVEHELANIRCPTLVLSGDEDKAISRERMEALHRGITGSTFQTIPMAGHTMTIENAPAVNSALADFL